MDILNWLYLAKNKFVRTTLGSEKDLMIFGSKVGFNKRGDKYQNYAMSVEDFAASLPAPAPAYKVYTARVTMATGVVTQIFENTLGASITWSASSGQITTGVVAPLIGQNNVYVQVTSNTTTSTPKIVSGEFLPAPWIVTIRQTDNAGTLDSDQFVYIEIRVYN
jgi:hypothetical protein